MKASDVVTIAIVAAGAYAAWRAIRAGQAAAQTVGGWIDSAGSTLSGWASAAETAASDAVNAVLAAPGIVANAAYDATGLGTKSSVPMRSLDPLIAYFQAHGYTSATEKSAADAGWTHNEIAAAAAVANSGAY